MVKPAKNTICLWFDRDAEDAARFYAKTFPDSSVGRGTAHRGLSVGEEGDILTVEFIVMSVRTGLNGGPAFKHNEAFSFQSQPPTSQTDRYWNAIVGNSGQESACGGARTSGDCLADYADRLTAVVRPRCC
jgi:2-polyprenyl-6-hydroxyphenyl methylase/3-demethylubiquinone-9 3-methyltransferase